MCMDWGHGGGREALPWEIRSTRSWRRGAILDPVCLSRLRMRVCLLTVHQEVPSKWPPETSFTQAKDEVQEMTHKQSHSRQRSWWRGVYDRLSHSANDDDGVDESHLKYTSNYSNASQHEASRGQSVYPLYDDPPPSSVMRMNLYDAPSMRSIDTQIHDAAERGELGPQHPSSFNNEDSLNSLPKLEHCSVKELQRSTESPNRPPFKHVDSFFDRVFLPSPVDIHLTHSHDGGGVATTNSHSSQAPLSLGFTSSMTPRISSTMVDLPQGAVGTVVSEANVTWETPSSSTALRRGTNGGVGNVDLAQERRGGPSKSLSGYAHRVKHDKSVANMLGLEFSPDHLPSPSTHKQHRVATTRNPLHIDMPPPPALTVLNTSPSMHEMVASVHSKHVASVGFSSKPDISRWFPSDSPGFRSSYVDSACAFPRTEIQSSRRASTSQQGLRRQVQPYSSNHRLSHVSTAEHVNMSVTHVQRSSRRQFSAPLDSQTSVWWKS